MYNDTDELPEKMPEYLKTAIKDITNEKEVMFACEWASVHCIV